MLRLSDYEIFSARRFLLLLVCCSLVPLFARPVSAESVAELETAEGKVEGRVSPAADWSSVERGQKFALHDAIRTWEQSRAGVRFSTGYLVRMNGKTTIIFDQQPAEQPKTRISVLEGIGHFFGRKSEEAPNVQTPHVSASIRGTEFVVEVAQGQTVISVLDGAVDAGNQYGSVTLGKGEQAIARAGAAPVKQILVRPVDAVQWALYYPAVLDLHDFPDLTQAAKPDEQRGLNAIETGDFGTAVSLLRGTTPTSRFGRAVLAYRRGSRSEALRILQSGQQTSGTFLFASALYLSAGQVDDANSALKQAEEHLAQAPRESRAALTASLLAQKSVIATVKLERESADKLASDAVALAPSSAAAALALSFVRQSQFRLDEARELLERAVALNPKSGVARARLAEILLGFGERTKAREEADEALQLDPKNAYALSVLGFAELIRNEPDRAAAYFQSAIQAENNFALAWLGLGLTEIKTGDLHSGQSRIEQAAALDPTVSLYRSYLGKAYYEDEREDYSVHEYQRAIDLDPNDPTPYLYRAYAKLALHRPIEAVKDLQESVDRNDNRGVFRSRLLLDQDQGTRSSGLGQIYSRLGFNELARTEAISALSRDYTNYSAHFLLADLYRDTQLNSRAQVTENLIGRLLSPVSFNANDLNIGGEASLNEYNTLFDRPVDRAKASVFGRSQTNAFGGRADYTLSTERLSMNVGYDGLNRQGFRDNDFLRSNQLFNLGQFAITPDDTLIWDGALTTTDQGDVNVNFNPRQEDPDFESDFDGVLVRGGYHRRIASGLHFIAQSFYNYGDFDGKNNRNDQRLSFLNITDHGQAVSAEPFVFDGRTDERTGIKQHLGRADAQILWDTELVSVVTGTSAGIEHLDGKEDAIISDPGSEPLLSYLQNFPVESEVDADEVTTQNFVYSTWHLTPWADLDAGLTYSRLKYEDNSFRTPLTDDRYTKDQWGPKAGAVFTLSKHATLRFAFSRSLDRTGRGGLGPLEPTFVGGFNQVFDGVRGSEQDLYGTGLDYKCGNGIFTGVYYQRRNIDLDVPLVNGGLTIDRNDFQTAVINRIDRVQDKAEVDRAGGYWYQLVSDTVAGVLDYQFERFHEDDPFPETQTNRVSTGINYFHPSGFFSFGRATYRYQERAGLVDPKEISDFWVADAGLGYELDHHHGALTLVFDNIFDKSFRYSAIADEDPVLPRFGAELSASFSF